MSGKRFKPVIGAVYTNKGGGTFLCGDVWENDTPGLSYCARMTNTKSGWTFIAHGLVQYEDGTTGMLYGLTFSSAETTAESVPGRILPTALNYVDSVIVSIKMLFTGQAGIQDMSGPVGIVKLMSDTAEESETTGLALLNLLSIGGLIAVNLAVMNLLPLPALDGGRVVCLLLTTAVEAITRKKINPKYEGYLHLGGMILLLILMAIITFKDIFTLFR